MITNYFKNFKYVLSSYKISKFYFGHCKKISLVPTK